MGMKVINLGEVLTALKLTDRHVTEETRTVLRQGAELIKQTARQYAPVDEHRIEKAIKVLPAQGNQYSLQLTIAVTGTVDGRSVDTYAAIVHEYQWHKRGPLTKVKGPKAGPRYLKRAVDHRKKEVIKALEAAVRKGISTGIDRSGVNRSRNGRR